MTEERKLVLLSTLVYNYKQWCEDAPRSTTDPLEFLNEVDQKKVLEELFPDLTFTALLLIKSIVELMTQNKSFREMILSGAEI